MSSDGFTTCLWFDGQAEEAAAHYVSIFKNSRIGRVTHYGEGMPQPAGSVLTVEFVANGQKFIALNGGPQFKFSEAISFQILCEDQDEIDYYWNSLTEGGEGGQCGWLKDRFGVSWQIEPTALLDMISDPDPQKSARVYAAMMPMGKLDLAALRKAYAGE
ncbi:VOC family protein [Streptomyces sp. DSM 40750]|uniref:VOC family protein n=1 Tax=Streptomyces sp. DSM 40750 TaxID=2801030 RepID=UPI00214BA8D9|nr:VOC family protein [Streptomyces sp. DSM 40750]UUU19479.1 VOC family protein [Streptomyces sp. DSM 40750]UUU27177.1 VOC family protein [Streptomyces sp. DSM 40750]